MYKLLQTSGMDIRSVTHDWRFRLALAVKLLAVICFVPAVQSAWFVPFVVNAFAHPSLDPWTSFLAHGGDALSFPYGPIMLLAYAPTTMLGWGLDQALHVSYFAGLGFRLVHVACDLGVLYVLMALYGRYWRQILLFYWASPLVFFVAYWHGQTDIVPVFLLLGAFYAIRRQMFATAAAALACAVAAKHSMLIAVPFFLIFVWLRRGLGARWRQFSLSFAGVWGALELPLLLSPGFKKLVLENPEAGKLLWLAIPMGEHASVYVTLLAYVLLVHYVWRMRRLSTDLLFAAMGVAFGAIILMTPASPGWFLWLAPVLAIHQSRKGGSAVMLVWGFSLAYASYYVFNASGSVLAFLPAYTGAQAQAVGLPPTINSVLYTAMLGAGLMTVLQILRDGVRGNDFYRIGKRPIAIGIAGDSSTGKTTFEAALLALFGSSMTVCLSGDDYHNWDRASPMWKAMTHLDPRANRLSQMVSDVRRIVGGEEITSDEYDHTVGRFIPSVRRRSRNVVIISGLHTFYPRALLDDLDVKFFLQMEETLRTTLKIKRDVEKRGHDPEKVLRAIERRKPDYDRYIKPQAAHANVVFTLQAINPDLLPAMLDARNIKLCALIRSGVYVDDLVRVLVGICGLHVNVDRQDGAGAVEIDVSGEVAPEDICLACDRLFPHMEELVDREHGFSSGIQGVMQLIALAEIDESLKRRRRMQGAKA